MQQQHIQLKEIIWEITGKCFNNCAYCGSKEVCDSEIDDDKILAIAEAITKYPPKEINISGGDPLLVAQTTHRDIIDKFNKAGMISKIIVNSKSIQSFHEHILGFYSWIGMSVSTHTELTKAKEILKENEWLRKKCTIITNFNVNNVFLFNKIKWLVQNFDLMWQIQFTMFQSDNNNQALYNNDVAFNEFFIDHLAEAMSENTRVILADNMNCGQCSAGIYSIGILENGDVVPCLSMRSWIGNIESVVHGNILQTDLQTLWTKGFQNYRYDEFMCCKDACKSKQIDINSREFINLLNKKISDKSPKIVQPLQPYMEKEIPFPRQGPIILYGVQPAGVMAYAVFSDPIDFNDFKDS